MFALKKASKIAATFLLAIYLVGGAVAGRGLMYEVPAVNWKGGTYFGATWVFWIKGSPVKLPIPGWAFTFEEG